MNAFTKGIVIAFVVFLFSILLLGFYRAEFQDPFDYLSFAFHRKRPFILDAAIATIPNALLFFYFIHKNKLSLARGVQVFIICLVVCLVLLKFVI